MYIPTLLILSTLSQLVFASPIPQLLTAAEPVDSLTSFDKAAPKCYSTCAISVEEACKTPTMCACDSFLLGIKTCLEASCPNDRKSEEWRHNKMKVCEVQLEKEEGTKTTTTKATSTATSTATGKAEVTESATSAEAKTTEAPKPSSKIPTSYIVGIAVSATLGFVVLIVIAVVLYRSCRGKSLTPHRFKKMPPPEPHLEETKKYFSSPPPPLPMPRFVSPLTVPVPAYTTPPLPPVDTPRPGTSASISTTSLSVFTTHAPPSTPAPERSTSWIFTKLPPLPVFTPSAPSNTTTPVEAPKGPNPYNAYLRDNATNPLRRGTLSSMRKSLRNSLTTRSWISETPSNARASTTVNYTVRAPSLAPSSFSTSSTPTTSNFPLPPTASPRPPAVPKIPAAAYQRRIAPKPKSWVYTSDDSLTSPSSDDDDTSLCFSDDDLASRLSKPKSTKSSRPPSKVSKPSKKRRSLRSIGKVGSGRGLIVIPTEKRVSTRPWEDRFWVQKEEEEEARSPVEGKGKGKERAVSPDRKGLKGKGRPMTPEGVDASELEEMEVLVGEMNRGVGPGKVI